MRILFIGGTRFVGLAMAREALRRGHAVDVFHRGITSATGLEGATHLLGDRNADLAVLARGEWDAVVDACGYRPHEIHAIADVLAGRFRKYVFVSTVSVYAADILRGSNEAASRADTSGFHHRDLSTLPIDGETYGPLKVLCEDAVIARHANRLMARPTFVIGPDDYTKRFPEWVRRIAAGGDIDAPGPRDAAMQYIDARDLAAFVVDAIERDVQGTFNTAGPRPPFTFEQFLNDIVAGVAPEGTRLRWLSAAEAKASSLEFPMWNEGSADGALAVDPAAAIAQGLASRPLRETARDVLEWIRRGPL